MEDERILLTVAVIAVGVALIAAGVAYFFISDLSSKISGYVTTGEANLTVESLAIVNFTNANISWGSGRVYDSVTAASLTTFETLPNVTGGNWSLNRNTDVFGLRIVNIGNVNVSLNLTGTKTAAALIGGTNPVYEWNVTEAEPGSCVNKTGVSQGADLNLNTFHNVNTSSNTDAQKCYSLRFEAANDEVRIDFNLTIPQDSSTGALGDVITATIVAQNPTGD
jgi:hypothetical protein